MMNEGNIHDPNLEKNRQYNVYDGKIVGLYDLGGTIGRGHFAVVKLAKHVFTGEKVAVKVIDKTKLDEISRTHLFQEVRCMKLVQHPNVVRLYEVIDTQTKLYLILELGDGGDMYDYIMKHDKGVDEETARKFFRQIVRAISYCHRLHVVHRDLKPENVIFFEKLGMVKLTDFGFSNRYYPGQKLKTSCGSLAYSAPEILLGDSYDAPKVDVWSLGVILYMIVSGHAPFQEANDSETLIMIMDCNYTVPSHVSKECCNLIESMLIRDPEKRATLEEVAGNKWLNAGDTMQLADYLPLISRECLSEEDHGYIIQKLVNGSIAAKEDIIDSLQKNEYNHITATYFLLAERKLRVQREKKAQILSKSFRGDSPPVAITSEKTTDFLQPKENTNYINVISPHVPVKSVDSKQFSSLVVPAENSHCYLPLARKCSLVQEEDDNSSSSVNVSSDSAPYQSGSVATSQKKPVLQHFLFSLPFSGGMNATTLRPKTSPENQFSALSFSNQKFKTLPSPGRRLHSVKSSPLLLLNEIDEEVELDELATKTLNSRHPRKHLHSPRSALSHAMLRLLGQQQKVGKSRTTSCSSSEASDDDGEGIKWKIGKLNCRRRDSSEDRTGGQGGSGGSGRTGSGVRVPQGNKSEGGRDDVGGSSGNKTNSSKSHKYNNQSVEDTNSRTQTPCINSTLIYRAEADSLNHCSDHYPCLVPCDKFIGKKNSEPSNGSKILSLPIQGLPNKILVQEQKTCHEIPLKLSSSIGFMLLQEIKNLPVHVKCSGWKRPARSKRVSKNNLSLRCELHHTMDVKVASKFCGFC
ncbi:uncharacterized protein LOC143231720 [Tachypleus tridentatus]|uniref:uncharacterized protein LOC143231720 n=1 Tax=Tachypleus tridentatus TaxID=6853 RepID=UPI003FD4A45A